jgi:hypothetical protein
MSVVMVMMRFHGIVIVVNSAVDSRSRRSGRGKISALSQRNGNSDGLAVRSSSHDSQFLYLEMTECVRLDYTKNNFAIWRNVTNLIVKSSGWNAVESRCLQGTLAATDGLDSGGDIVSGVLSVAFQFRTIAICFAVIDVMIFRQGGTLRQICLFFLEN